MTSELLLAIGVAFPALTSTAFGKVRRDFIALSLVTSFASGKALTFSGARAEFSNSVVVLVARLLVIKERP